MSFAYKVDIHKYLAQNGRVNPANTRGLVNAVFMLDQCRKRQLRYKYIK